MVALRRRGSLLLEAADGLTADAVVVAFGHAGAGPGWVRQIAALVPPAVGVTAAMTRPAYAGHAYAGHGPEALGGARTIEELAHQVAVELVQVIRPGQRLAFYGQSLGAIVAFETARCVEASAPWDLTVLVAVAAPAPAVAEPTGRHDAMRADDELREELIKLGAPARLLDDERIRERLLKSLRADLLLFERYPWGNDRVTAAPLIAVRSREDPYVSQADADLWRRAAVRGHADVVEITGGHVPFGEALTRCIAAAVTPVTAVSSREDE